jgi:branched-chain amino acid transport system permease protein
VAGWGWGYTIKTFPSPVEGWQTGTALVGPHSLFTIIVISVLLAFLFAFFSFTKAGLALRASSVNPVSARLTGVRVDRMLALGWGLAAAIGAVGGMLIAPVLFLDPSMMLSVLLYGFAAALLGGLSSPIGAVAGGVLFGIVENLMGAFVLGNDLKLVFALATVIAVLLVRPQGLFGRIVVKRF